MLLLGRQLHFRQPRVLLGLVDRPRTHIVILPGFVSLGHTLWAEVDYFLNVFTATSLNRFGVEVLSMLVSFVSDWCLLNAGVGAGRLWDFLDPHDVVEVVQLAMWERLWLQFSSRESLGEFGRWWLKNHGCYALRLHVIIIDDIFILVSLFGINWILNAKNDDFTITGLQLIASFVSVRALFATWRNWKQLDTTAAARLVLLLREHCM